MKLWRHIKKPAIGLALLLATITIGTVAAFAKPEPFFPYSRSVGAVTFYDVHPIPESAEIVLQEIDVTLKNSIFAAATPLNLFIAHDGWRNWLFFRTVQFAGGVVYYPVTYQHGFLAGADYDRGTLLKRDRLIAPPRTLAYYGIHELTHVLTGKRTGTLRYHQLPEWIREGLSDYVALGPPDDISALDARLADAPIDLDLMNELGVYVRHRMLVAWYLEHENWSLDQLLASDMTAEAALIGMRRKTGNR